MGILDGVTRPAASLAHFPVPIFSAVMGIGGLSLAWQRSAQTYDVSSGIGTAIFWCAASLFAVLVLLYALKWIMYPQQARSELRHPVRMAFAPTLTIAALVVATAGQTIVPDIAAVLWWGGALGHLVATILIVSAWMNRPDIGLMQVTPAWFIPVVGNAVTPLAAPEVGSVDLAWVAFGVGLVFWAILLPIVVLRLAAHTEPMPAQLLPTLAILVAPPAVIQLSWLALSGDGESPVNLMLFGVTLSFVAIVIAEIPRLRAVPFAVTYWAYTFPSAAAATSALAVAHAHSATIYDVVAIGLLAVTSALAVIVSVRTVLEAVHGRLLRPEIASSQ